MSRLNPIWTAGRLNEALARAQGDVHLDLGPDGHIATIAYPTSSRGLQGQSAETRRRFQGSAFVHPITEAGYFDEGLRQLPPLLAFLAINPEPWCRTVVNPGALESVGPFFDYTNPLWEWLVRAARAGRAHLFPLRESFAYFGSARQEYPLDNSAIPLPDLVRSDQTGAPAWLRATLGDFELGRVYPNVKSTPDATAVAAGLLEMHDLVGSHELAQSIEGRGGHQAGDYWHAIHHRREPDAFNAKYWFRQVGAHPVHERLAMATRAFFSLAQASDQATELDKSLHRLAPKGVWDPFAFVDFCGQAVAEKDLPLVRVARQLQFLEMTWLLESAYEDATT